MLAEFSVRRWQLTLLLFIALLALGGYALTAIPKAEDPTFPVPNFKVVAVLPGASPRDLERLVVDPVEARLSTLSDLKNIRSEARDGLATIFAEFQPEIDADRKHDEVLREINGLRASLPQQLLRLDVFMYNAANVSILEIALVGEQRTYRELDLFARKLKRRLEGVRGVGEVHLEGLPRREVTVALDMAKLVQLSISPADVYRAILDDSQNVPAGGIELGATRFTLVTDGDYDSLEELKATLVRSADGQAVHVSDVAHVELGDGEASQLARFDGKQAVLVAVAAKEGENIFHVRSAVGRVVEEVRRKLPASLSLRYGFDQSVNVAHRLWGFSRDFVLAILLVLVTLLPLGLRASLVVMVAIPLSLSIGIFLLKLGGFSINQLSIVGFVLALGLLVDDSVVVVENISRHLRGGATPRDAAIVATREITGSVTGCTATMLFAFFPLLVLPGASGQFIRSLPMALALTVAASLFVSLTIVPFLASYLIREPGQHGNVFLRGMTWFVEAAYRRILGHAIARPGLTLSFTALLFVGSLALIPRVGFSLFPKAEIPQFLLRIDAAEGASLAQTERAARFAEEVLSRHREISQVATSIGKGHPQVYYNVPAIWEKVNTAEIFAQADLPQDARPKLYARLRDELSVYPGAKIELLEFENGPPLEAPIAIRILGDDETRLREASSRVEDILRKTPGTRDIRNPAADRRTDLRIDIDRERAALLGVDMPMIDQAVRVAATGLLAGKYREDGVDEPRDIRITLPRTKTSVPGGARPDLDVLEAVHVPSRQGILVPLAQLARLRFQPSPTTVRHHNKERCATVTAHVNDGFNIERITRSVLEQVSLLHLPEVRIEPAGQLEAKGESFAGLGVALMIAAFGILTVLILEFQTFKSVLSVASVIPLGVIGGVLALYLTGHTFSFVASIGFIALMGIEIKNSILLVDFANQLREGGMPLDEAIQHAGEVRFVPVVLTTLTTLGGLIPLILEGSNLYSPLALVILGGLLTSTVLTRIVTPVLYKLLAPSLAVTGAEAATILDTAAAE